MELQKGVLMIFKVSGCAHVSKSQKKIRQKWYAKSMVYKVVAVKIVKVIDCLTLRILEKYLRVMVFWNDKCMINELKKPTEGSLSNNSIYNLFSLVGRNVGISLFCEFTRNIQKMCVVRWWDRRVSWWYEGMVDEVAGKTWSETETFEETLDDITIGRPEKRNEKLSREILWLYPLSLILIRGHLMLVLWSNKEQLQELLTCG